jgi:hypothetical protein
MSIEPITRLQRFLRVLADSSADMPEPLRNLEKCCCYACGHLDTRPELHTTLEKLIASVRDKSIVPPKPNTRLEKYVAAMAGVWDDELPEPITREDKILFEAASGEDVTLSGNPLILENCIGGKALKALHVYGKSTQDGTPSPDNPVPIVSAGDDGSVMVKVTGKNLLNPALFQNNKYQGFNAETGYYGIDSVNGYWITGLQPCLPSTTYHFNKSVEGGCFYDKKKNVIGIADFAFAITTPAKCAYYCINFSSANTSYGTPVIATVSEPATYSPYREQLITLPTPTGLPGIPVASGGNYTDQSGQQWVCDEVDLERGMKVQRVNAVDLSTCTITGTTELTVTKRLSILLPVRGVDYKVKAICSRLQFLVSFTEDTPHFYVDINNAQVFIPIGSKNPEEGEYILFYVLAAPIETPLTPAEIAAYKSLTTYAPTTVLQATDGAGLEATYKCNVRKAEKTINDLYAELTAELEA